MVERDGLARPELTNSVQDVLLWWRESTHVSKHDQSYLLCLTLPFSGFKFAQLEMSTYPYIIIGSLVQTHHAKICFAEAILAMLVSTFIFEPSDKEVIWRNSVIATPATKGKESETPHLPLKISLV